MRKKEITLRIEFENHKLSFNVYYEEAKDRRIAECIVKHAFDAIDSLRGKRANNAMNSYKIEKGCIK